MSEQNKQRVLSLDFFRGLTVAAMILVNNPGNWNYIYAPLEHAEWNGCTPTDLIFPFFLFIVGISIAFSMSEKKNDPTQHKKVILVATKRGTVLFGLGLILALYPRIFTNPIETIQNLRLLGVLQRIGIVFIISTFIFIKCSQRNIFKIFISLLIFYWFMMTFIPVPHVGYPNLEKETNLGAWIDRSLLTEAHLWKLSKTWDPEGLFSTLPAIASSLFGVLVGIYLKRKDVLDAVKIAWLFSIGTLGVIAGLIWDLQFPINKSLWTSSYVLYTGGLATIGLALCYWIIDVQGYKKYTKPFVVYGVNAITVFCISAIIAKTLNFITITLPNRKIVSISQYLYETIIVTHFSPINASLCWAVFWVIFWLAVLWVMYNKKIFIKI